MPQDIKVGTFVRWVGKPLLNDITGEVHICQPPFQLMWVTDLLPHGIAGQDVYGRSCGTRFRDDGNAPELTVLSEEDKAKLIAFLQRTPEEAARLSLDLEAVKKKWAARDAATQ